MKRAVTIGAACVAGLLVVLVAIYYLFPGVVLGVATQAARWSAGVSRAEVQVDDHRWVYLDGGKGEVVLFVHGFGESKDMWYNFPAAFAGKYRLVVPDLPGFGENSQVKKRNYGIPEQSARLDRFVKAVGLTRFHLVGSSMGGGIAGYYASEHPEKVASLTLIGPFGVMTDTPAQVVRARQKDKRISLAVKDESDFDNNLKLAYDRPPQMPAHLKAYVVTLFARNYDFHFKVFNDLWAGGLGILENRLRKITSPTLVIWGRNDRIFDVSSAEIFKRGIGNSRVVVMDAGHVVHNDQPGKAAAVCLGFLKEHGAP